jgi:hypothetical protein
MRTRLLLGLMVFSLSWIAFGGSTLEACQLLKLPEAQKILGQNLTQNPGELPGQNGMTSKSCFYANQGWSNRTGSGAARQFLELTVWTHGSPKAATAAFQALQNQMQSAIQSGKLPPKMKGARVLAVSGYGKNAFVLEMPVPSDPPQEKPLVTRLYWLKGALQVEVMAWVLNDKTSALELTKRAADLVNSRLP